MATKQKEKKQRALDIGEVMLAVDTRQRDYYAGLSAEQKKEFSPWLIQRYTSSINHTDQDWIEHYLIMTNDIVNVNFSDIQDPEMLWKLLSIVGIGKNLGKYGHPFIPPPGGSKKKQNAFKEWLGNIYEHLDDQELDIWISNLDKESARSMLEQFQVKDKDVIASANDL